MLTLTWFVIDRPKPVLEWMLAALETIRYTLGVVNGYSIQTSGIQAHFSSVFMV